MMRAMTSLLVVTSMVLLGHVTGAQELQDESGRCERITIPLCTDMKYNMTRMPNLVGLTNQKEAALQVHEFIPLVQFGCSPLLKFFLCSLYAPMCTEQVDETMVIPACRSMCLTVKSDCEPILKRLNFHWPAVLDCSKLPERSDRTQLCIDPPGGEDLHNLGGGTVADTITHNAEMVRLLEMLRGHATTTRANSHVIEEPGHEGGRDPGLTSLVIPDRICPHRYVSVEGTGNSTSCAPRCRIDVLYRDRDKRFAEVWMTVWSVVCLVSTALTVVTFLINTNRFRYPERPIVILAACSAAYSAAYIIRISVGPDLISCDKSGSLPFLVQGDLKNTWCVVIFIALYFFGMAASLWWVILTISFYLAAGRKWGKEAIEGCSNYFHVVAWSLPAAKTALVLALHKFDGEELTGLCYVGNHDPTSLIIFVLVPLLIYLIIGVGCIGAGFAAMFRIRNDLIQHDGADIRKLEKLMIKIGVFSVFYTLYAVCVVASYLHQRLHMERWRLISMATGCKLSTTFDPSAVQMDCSLDESIATVPVEMLRVFMLLAAGTTTGVWICSCKTLQTWCNFLTCARNGSNYSPSTANGISPHHGQRSRFAAVSSAQQRDAYVGASYRKCDAGKTNLLPAGIPNSRL